jgi:L-lactate utilization protein LutB
LSWAVFDIAQNGLVVVLLANVLCLHCGLCVQKLPKDGPIREVVVRKQSRDKKQPLLRICSLHQRRSWKRIASQRTGYVFQLQNSPTK